MAIIGLAGQIGSGKSHAQLMIAIEYAEERRKQIVTNFPVNRQELIRYCAMPREAHTLLGNIQLWWGEQMWELSKLIKIFKHYLLRQPLEYRLTKTWKPKYPYLLSLLQKGMGVIEIVNPEHLETLMIPESVICLDEAGVFLNARDFSKTSKRLLADLAQSRKDGSDLVWAAQFDGQVDRQFRQLTQFWWHCRGFTLYNKKMRRPELVWKERHYFMADDYDMWVNNPKVRADWIKTRFAYASATVSGFLSRADKQLFNCFDSFSRLDLQGSNAKVQISTTQQCLLPKTYYSNCNQVLEEEDYLRQLRLAYGQWNISIVSEIRLRGKIGMWVYAHLASLYWLQRGQWLYITARQEGLDQWLKSVQYLMHHQTVQIFCWGSINKKSKGSKTRITRDVIRSVEEQEPKKPFRPDNFVNKQVSDIQDALTHGESGGLVDEMLYVQNGKVNYADDSNLTVENLVTLMRGEPDNN